MKKDKDNKKCGCKERREKISQALQRIRDKMVSIKKDKDSPKSS